MITNTPHKHGGTTLDSLIARYQTFYERHGAADETGRMHTYVMTREDRMTDTKTGTTDLDRDDSVYDSLQQDGSVYDSLQQDGSVFDSLQQDGSVFDNLQQDGSVYDSLQQDGSLHLHSTYNNYDRYRDEYSAKQTYEAHAAREHVQNIDWFPTLPPKLHKLLLNVPDHILTSFLRFVLCVMRKCNGPHHHKLDFRDVATQRATRTCAVFYFG